MDVIDVFADVACPFAHVGLHRFVAHRRSRGREEPRLRVRAWPLELVNQAPFDGTAVASRVEALRAEVAPDMFARFDPSRFPATTLPAMASEAAAYRAGPEVGEGFSLAVRRALFDDGRDVSDVDELRQLREAHGVPEPTAADDDAVRADLAAGQQRGVEGSPHFFTPHGEFFCPSLEIEHGADGLEVSFDSAGFHRFTEAVFG